MNKSPFNDFLKAKHSEDYTGTDDNMDDSFDRWFDNLDIDDIIAYANEALQESKS